MADDIARLGIEIDSTGVEKAKLSLDGLAQSGTQAEGAARGVGEAWNGVGQKAAAAGAQVGGTAAAFKQGNDALRQQQQELGKLLGQIDPVIAALDRLDQQEKKLRGFRAAGALDAETFQRFNSQIQQNRAALGTFSDALDKTGISAGQTRAALRQLPAQFSDIFISLQAGQSPLSVFLQQGSQIKDSFGGIAPALRAVGGAVAAMINPFTVAAVVVGTLAIAYQKGSQEAVEFNKALISTGNVAGTSAGQLQEFAKGIDAVVGTQANAAAALAQVTASGAFTVDQIENIATAAIAMERATGKAVQSTISEFKKLADEPAQAAAELNEQYHFLTASIFDQINALEQQGDAAGAAQLAIDTFADVQIRRSKEIEESLGFLETGWRNVKDGAAEAWDEMLGVGRPETPEDRLSGLAKGNAFNLGRIATRGLVLGPVGAAVEGFKQFQAASLSDEERSKLIGENLQEIQDRDEKAWQEGLQQQLNDDAIGAQARIDQLKESAASNAEKRKNALDDLARDLSKIRSVSPNDPRLDPANIAKLEANIEERFKDRQRKAPAVRDDAATRLLLNLREQESALNLQLSTTDKLTSAELERAKFLQQIADLQSKDILTAEQKSLLANKDAITAQLNKNVALSEEIRLRDEALKLQDRIAQVQEAITAGNVAREEQQADILGAAGLSKQEREIRDSFDSIRKEYARYREDLTRDLDKGALNSDEYADAVTEIDRQLAIALDKQRKYYEDLAKVEADAVAGTKTAIQDYIDESSNLGKQVNELVTDILVGLEDALVEFTLTGKLSFKDLANSIITDLARIGARQTVAAIASSALGAFGGGSNIFGMFGGGGGSATFTGAQGFEGGGFTGEGQRVGGVDGRGGFLAVLHPNENVIDNLRPGSTSMGGRGGNSVSIGNIVLPGVTNEREARQAGAAVARQINTIVAQSARFS